MTVNTYTGYRKPNSAPTYSPRPSIVARLGAMLRAATALRGFDRAGDLRLTDHLASDMGLAPSHKELPAVRPFWRL